MKPHLIAIDDELKSFLELCKKSQLSEDQIAHVVRPLTEAIRKKRIKQLILYVLLIVLLAPFVYHAATSESASWHLSALGRVALIKLLPVWNWRHLKYEKCLLPSYANKHSEPSFNCDLCEINDRANSVRNIDPRDLDDFYVKLHKPVVVHDAVSDWHLPRAGPIHRSVPCKLSTNVHSGAAVTVGTIVDKLDSFERYFVHFQNCDFDAVKSFRRHAPKPEVLPGRLSPVQYSWLLMSRDYNVTNFKTIELIEPIALVGQVVGSNRFRLRPTLNCEEHCPIVDVELREGDALVLSSLYNLSYRPSAKGKSVAVILEMH